MIKLFALTMILLISSCCKKTTNLFFNQINLKEQTEKTELEYTKACDKNKNSAETLLKYKIWEKMCNSKDKREYLHLCEFKKIKCDFEKIPESSEKSIIKL